MPPTTALDLAAAQVNSVVFLLLVRFRSLQPVLKGHAVCYIPHEGAAQPVSWQDNTVMLGVVIVTELRADWISSDVLGYSTCHTQHTLDALVLDSLTKEW